MSTPATSPAPQPASEEKEGGLWVWLLGLVVAGIVILGVGGMIVAGYLSRSIQVTQRGHEVEITTPAGGLKMSRNAAADTGLPVYPGALVNEPGGTVELMGADGEAVGVTAAKYRTPDPLEKVDTWYQEQLGKDFSREGIGITLKKKDIFGIEVRSDDIAFISDKDDMLRVVALRKRGLQTEIAMARIGKTEAQ